jgi:hypothetical protein
MLTHPSKDPKTHLTFLTSLLSRIEFYSAPSTTPTASASFPVSKLQQQEARVLLLATIAHAKLVYGDVEGTKADMDAAWKVLDDLEGVDSGVNAAYYGVAADYYKVSILFASGFREHADQVLYAGTSGIWPVLQKLTPLPGMCGPREGHVAGGAPSACARFGHLGFPWGHDL